MKVTLLGMVAILGVVAAVFLIFLMPKQEWDSVVAEN